MTDLSASDEFDFDHFLAQLHAHQLWERTGRRVEFQPPCDDLPTRRHYCVDEDPERTLLIERITKINAEDTRSQTRRSHEEAEADRRRLSEALGLPYIDRRSITVDKIVKALSEPEMYGGRINVAKTAAKHGITAASIHSFLKHEAARRDKP